MPEPTSQPTSKSAWTDELRRRLAPLHLEPSHEAELIEELSQHLDDRFREHMLHGATADEARERALAELGTGDALAAAFDAAGEPRAADPPKLGAPSVGGIIADLASDLRFGWRMLRKTPALSAIAVLALALGIGANTAIFSVVDALMLRPLPFAEPDRIVEVFHTNPNMPRGRESLSPADLLEIRDALPSARTLRGVGAFQYIGDGVSFVAGNAPPEQIYGARVSAGFFDVLGVRPLLGRTFVAGDDARDAPALVVLGYDFWKTRLAGDRRAIGEPIILNGRSYTVVGVMPPGFWFPRGDLSDFWINMRIEPPMREGPFGNNTIARLAPGATIEQSDAELERAASRVRARFPKDNIMVGGEHWTLVASPLHTELVGDLRPALLMLVAAVGLVLLIACVDVTNLLLARATAREGEMAVRLALGAGRGRIIRQMLAESVVLALVGAVAGVLLARVGTPALVGLAPSSVAMLHDVPVRIDVRVLLVTLALVVASAVLVGIAPALLGSRTAMSRAMSETGRSGMESRGRRQFRGALVAAECALSVVLLVGAGLLIRSLIALERVPPGYRTDHLLTARLSLPGVRYGDSLAQIAFRERLVERMRQIPGVRDAGVIAGGLPPNGVWNASNFAPEHAQFAPGEAEPIVGIISVDAGYLRALGIPLIGGRLIDDHDAVNQPHVLLVSRAFARRFFGSPSAALGKRLRIGGPEGPDTQWYPIVGVVADAKYMGLGDSPLELMYTAYSQEPDGSLSLVLHTSGDPSLLVDDVRRAVASLDPQLAVSRVRTMDEQMRSAVAAQRFQVALLASLAGVALVLAAIGIYGVMSYAVSRRTREMGVRLALGAQPRDVIALVIGEGTRLVGYGLVAGVIASLVLARVVRAQLFGVSTSDPVTLLGVTLVLGTVALVACWLPARRATSVDPSVALRGE